MRTALRLPTTSYQLLSAAVLLSLLTGCISSLDKHIPAITAAKFNYTRTGKFSSTTITAENLKTDAEKVTADKVNVRHSNAWIPNIEITLEGYERLKTSEEK